MHQKVFMVYCFIWKSQNLIRFFTSGRFRALHSGVRRPGIFLAFLIFLQLTAKGVFAQIGRDTLMLQEVEIIGANKKGFPEILIKSPRIEFSPVRDIGDFLRNEPNVAGIRKGGVSIDPVVRGFKYSQVTVLLNNGVKIEGGCPNRMDPVASHVESENIDKIEIVKGPYILKYGPVMGALINLQTVRPHPWETPSIHGKVLYGFETNWNGQREHIYLEGGNKRVYFNAGGGFKGYGSYTAGNHELYNTSFQKLYGTAGLGFSIGTKSSLIVNYMYDQGKNVLFPALPMDERLDKTHVASVNFTSENISKTWERLQFQAYFSPVHHVMDNLNRASAKTMQAVTTVDARNGGGKLVTAYTVGNHSIVAGVDYEDIWKNGEKVMTMKMVMEGDTFISVKHFNVWNNACYRNAGLFGEYKIPLKTTEFSAALRLDYNQAHSQDTFRLVKEGISYFDETSSAFFNVSFGLGVRIELPHGFYLNGALGLGTRSPSLLERFIKLMPVQFDSYDYLGNPQLKPEHNWQADLSAEWHHQEAGAFSIGGFFSLITNYITGKVLPSSVIKPSTQGAPGVKQFYNAEAVYLTGFEVTWQSPVSKQWFCMLNAAATWGIQPDAVKYVVTGGQVVDQVAVHNDPLPEIPPLEGTIQGGYRFFKNKLIPSVTVRIVNAQMRVSESYGEQTTPGFVTAALAVRYSPWKFISVAGGIENIFDTPYYEHLNRRMIGSTSPLYEPGRAFYVNAVFRF